jgi:hypothetical protein
MKKQLWWMAALALGGACHKKTDVNADNFAAGLDAYLAKRGDLCIGRSAWPIDIDEHETPAQSRDALQLPVLEQLGLVESTKVTLDSMGMVDARRYRLTASGRQFYLDRQTRRPVPAPNPNGDFCVAKLTLDRVVRWELAPGERSAEVAYTYEIEAPAWARAPGFQRVFPAIARVVLGARTAELKETFTLTARGWIANELLPAGEIAAGAASARHRP